MRYLMAPTDGKNGKNLEKKTVSSGNTSAKPGPVPDRVKIQGDWEDAVKKALSKKPPQPQDESKKPTKG
jgi:translation initiation factor 1 (eIF-1/SUI1)